MDTNRAFEGADIIDVDDGPVDHLGLSEADRELLRALAEIEVMEGNWLDE